MYGSITQVDGAMDENIYTEDEESLKQKTIFKKVYDAYETVCNDFFENHYYDDIEDGELRMKEVLELLDRKIKIPTKILPSIKKHYKERLIKNYEHLLYLDSINKKMFGDKLDKLLF